MFLLKCLQSLFFALLIFMPGGPAFSDFGQKACDSYDIASEDKAICVALTAMVASHPNCFSFEPKQVRHIYNHLKKQKLKKTNLLRHFTNSYADFKKDCTYEDYIVWLDNIFIAWYRRSVFAKEHLLNKLNTIFKNKTNLGNETILVPGSGHLYEAGVFFELFDPWRIDTVDPFLESIEPEFFNHHAYQKVDLSKMYHYQGNIGIFCEPELCGKGIALLSDEYSLIFFIHPGYLFKTCESSSLHELWENVFATSLEVLHDKGRAVFIVRNKKELGIIKQFISDKGIYHIFSQFCGKGILMRPYQYPDDRVYKCFLAIEKHKHDEL